MLLVASRAFCGTVSTCHPSVPRLAVYPWLCAGAELCDHHRAWNESGLVSLSGGQCLMALLLGVSTLSTREPVRPQPVTATLPVRKKQQRGLCGCWPRYRWDRVFLV